MLLISLSETKKKGAFTTPWTFLHFYGGFFFSLLTFGYTNINARNSFIIYSLLHLIYECKDFYITYLSNIKISKDSNLFGLLHKNNTLINSLGDQIFGMIGWYIGYLFFKNIKTHAHANKITFILFIIGILLVLLFNICRLG